MEGDNYHTDREKDFQIERLANENERLKEKIQEKDEKIRRLENDLISTIHQKINRDELKKIVQEAGIERKENNNRMISKGSVGKKKKTYKTCQKCGVGLVSPKPGQKFCIRHEKLRFKAGKKSGKPSGYKHIKVFQGGSPGGGKKR